MVHLAYFVQINWIIYIDYVQLDSSIIIQYACLDYLFKLGGRTYPTLQSSILFSLGRIRKRKKITYDKFSNTYFLGHFLVEACIKTRLEEGGGAEDFQSILKSRTFPSFLGQRMASLFFASMRKHSSGCSRSPRLRKTLNLPPLLPSSFSLLYVEEKFEVPCKPCARNALKDYLKLGYEIFIEEIFSSFFFFFFLINLRRNHRRIFFFFHKFKRASKETLVDKKLKIYIERYIWETIVFLPVI